MTLTVEQEQLVLDNIGLAHHVAKRFYHENLSHEDLASEGMIGLINATKTFNRELGYEFSAYAGRSIRNQILKVFRKPQFHATSLNHDVGYDNQLIDLITSDGNTENKPISNVELIDALQQLDSREFFIVVNYFGLFNQVSMSQREIGEILKMSQPMVSRALNKALRKLESYLRGE